LLFAILIAFYLYGLGKLPLVGPDEPRYAQVAREMFLSGDLITPRLGGHTWFEKPALLYWLMVAAFKVLASANGQRDSARHCAGSSPSPPFGVSDVQSITPLLGVRRLGAALVSKEVINTKAAPRRRTPRSGPF